MRNLENRRIPFLWAPNTDWGWKFFLFVLIGQTLGYIMFPTFERFGPLGIIVILAIVPSMMVASVLAIPQLLNGIRVTAARFTWWHWLMLLLFLSGENFRVRGYQQAQAEPLDAWTALRLVPEAIVLVALALRFVSKQSSLRRIFTGLPGILSLFASLGLVSAAWSVYPSWTIYKSFEYLMDVTVFAAIVDAVHTAEDYEAVFEWTLALYTLETLTAWVGALVAPGQAWDSDGRLLCTFPMIGANTIGTTGAALAIVAISRVFRIDGKAPARPWYFVLMIFGMASMLAAQTRHAYGGFLFALALVLILTKKKWLGVALMSASTLVFIFTSAGDKVWTYLQRNQTHEVFASATGRVTWWKFAWEQLSQHPLTGLGAFAGGKFGVLAKMNMWDATYLHSDWVEIAVGTSFWGVLVFSGALAGTWWFLVKRIRFSSVGHFDRQLAIDSMGILALLTVHSFFNNELSWHPALLFLMVVGYVEISRRNISLEMSHSRNGRVSASIEHGIRPLQPISPKIGTSTEALQ